MPHIIFLGVYAGLATIHHGIFESMQGNRAPGSLILNTVGATCPAEVVSSLVYKECLKET